MYRYTRGVGTRKRPELRIQVDRAMEQRWPGSDAEATELVINLMTLGGQVDGFADALCARHGVPSPAAFNVLTVLEGNGAPLLPSEIAARVFVSRPTITGVVASLEKRGLVRLRAHPTDGRKALIELTPRGRACVRRMRPELHAAEKRWIGCLDAASRRRLRQILALLQAHAPTLERR